MDGPGGRIGAGGGWLRHPQCFDAVAPDAVVYPERQFVAVGVVGQSIEFERTTVADGWPAGLVRESVYGLGGAAVHLEWPAGIVRRCTGFFLRERSRRLLTGQGGRARAAALADPGVRGLRSGGTGSEHGGSVTVRQCVWPDGRPVAGAVLGPARAALRPIARAIHRPEGRCDDARGQQYGR